MWVPRTVLLASILMMFIPGSASKPQGGVSGIPENNCEFIKLLQGGCKCVPLLSCCDDKGDDSGGGNFLDIITQKQNRPCGNPTPDPNVGNGGVSGGGNSGGGNSGGGNSGGGNSGGGNSGGGNSGGGNSGGGNSGGGNFLEAITLKQDKPIVDMQEHKCKQCDDILEVCCIKECPKSEIPAPCPVVPPPTNQCGIRNNNGIGIEMTGMDGRQAQLNEFPWMAGVLEKDDTFVAGGSLVHKRVVLTAGHKVYNLDASNLVARLGDWDLNSTSEPIPAQTINVVKIVFHKDFQRPTMVNNIALLILESDAVLSDTVMPICMPKPDQTFDGADCLVTGWGKDMFGKTGRYQTIMKKLTVPAVGHRQCQDALRKTRLGSTFDLHESFNCAGGQKEDPCTGDGGSPLVCPNPENPNEYVQMGVVSWGIGCGIIGNPGVYGSIPKTEDWILRTIQAEVGNGGGIGFDERVPN